ncbi:MAG: tetraacyldisaccharide 4'-kinase [Bdellovibrio sp.]
MRAYLRPLSFLYEQIVGVKNSLYNRGIIEIYKAPVPVISIGNLTVGGTGKTPITDFCLKALIADKKKVAVVSRSYRADASDPCWVDVTHPFGARYYGDEPMLLASANPEVAVYVGDTKWKTAEFASSDKRGQFDVILIDDGFQHRKLHRDLNLVVLDATEVLTNYETVPVGRARESWSGLDRADVIILTKCNLASDEDLKKLEARLPRGKEVLYFNYEIQKFHSEDQTKTADELKGQKLFLVSAIARPDVFENMMRHIGEVSKKSIHFRDHHQYTDSDVKKIWDEFQKSQADYLITTAKDAVKLRPLMPQNSKLWSSWLEVNEAGKKGRLHEIISKVLR